MRNTDPLKLHRQHKHFQASLRRSMVGFPAEKGVSDFERKPREPLQRSPLLMPPPAPPTLHLGISALTWGDAPDTRDWRGCRKAWERSQKLFLDDVTQRVDAFVEEFVEAPDVMPFDASSPWAKALVGQALSRFGVSAPPLATKRINWERIDFEVEQLIATGLARGVRTAVQQVYQRMPHLFPRGRTHFQRTETSQKMTHGEIQSYQTEHRGRKKVRDRKKESDYPTEQSKIDDAYALHFEVYDHVITAFTTYNRRRLYIPTGLDVLYSIFDSIPVILQKAIIGERRWDRGIRAFPPFGPDEFDRLEDIGRRKLQGLRAAPVADRLRLQEIHGRVTPREMSVEEFIELSGASLRAQDPIRRWFTENLAPLATSH